MKRRIIAVLCAGILALSLAGCGQGSQTTGTSGKTESQTAKESQTAGKEVTSEQAAEDGKTAGTEDKTAQTGKSETENQSQAAGTEELKAPEGFPKDPITVVVGFAAGGGVDTATRLMMKYVQEYVDVPIIVTNTTGASGVVAVTDVLKKPADGYTMVTLASGAALGDCTGTATYSYLDDIEFIALQDSVPYALSFRKDDERFQTGEEFLAYVKEHPGEITVALSGVNNANHLAALSMVEDYDYQMELVPFDGSANAKTAFLGGHVDAFCETILETKSMMEEGMSVCVCTFGNMDFSSDLPGVPTSEDLGMKLKITGTNRGYGYRKGVDPEIVNYMSAIMKKVTEDPRFIEECKKMGLEHCINYMDASEYRTFAEEEYNSYMALCQALGIAKK